MAVDVGSAVGYLDLDISGFLAGLKSAQSEADKKSKSIGEKISGIGSGFSSVGTTLTKKVTVPLLGIGAAGLKVATDFEKGMSEVKAISGATGEQFDALRDKAIELGADTAFSAGEVAEAMTEMAKAGWSSEQIIDGMSGVLAAAAASGEGLATVSTIVADAITGFGMEAKDSTKVADLLTQAANSGTIGISDLGETFKYIAPVAGAMGLSIEDVTTAVSAMSMAGIKGSQAGTSLRTMLTNLVNPSEDCAGALEELGISATNSDGSMKSLDEIVANLRTSFSGLTEAEKAQYAAIIAGKTGMSGMLSLLNLTEEEYNAIAESMDNASGVAEETAAVMQDNLQSKVEQLGGALESLAIKFADYVIPYIRKFVEWLTTLVDKLTNLNPETQKMILKFAGLAAAAGPVITVFGKVITGTGKVVSAFGKLTGGFKAVWAGGQAGVGVLAKIGGALAGTAGSVLAFAALFIAAFVSLWKNNEEFRNKIIAIWDQIKETFSILVSGIVERLNSLGFDFENMGEVLKTIWQGFCDFLAPVFEGVFNNISIIFETFTNIFFGVWDLFSALFSEDWQGVWDALKTIFISIWNGIKDWFVNILDTLKGILDVVLGWFGTSWSNCWNSIKTVAVTIWNNIKGSASTIFNSIKTTLSNIWNSIKTTASNAWTSVKTTITNAWNNIKTTVSTKVNNVKTTISTTFNSIKTTISNVLTKIKTTISTVWTSIKTTISTVINNIKTTISTIWNSIKTTITTIINTVKTTVVNTFNSIKTTTKSVWNSIKTAISTPFNSAKSIISSVVSSIKSTISTGFNSAKTTVTNVFNNIKTKISSVMDSAKTLVTGAIDKIKGAFDFSWSLPKLKLPHISVKGGVAPYGIGGKGSLPSFSIEWFRKAMDKGMILNKATIFGLNPVTGKFLGAGEAGSETIVGTKSLLSMIKQTVYSAIGPLVAISYELARASAELGYVTYNGFTKLKESKEKQDTTRKDTNGNGDTFVFYSPKAIDEIEAAKQMKKTKRELAEGF